MPMTSPRASNPKKGKKIRNNTMAVGQSGHENHEGQRFVNCLPNERLRVIALGEVDRTPDQNKLWLHNGFHGCKTPGYPMYPLAV
jgi:hypothetical protein